MSTARTTAFDTLLRTARGAWADEILRHHAAALNTQEAGLAHQLVFACLRYQLQLDFLINHFAGLSIKLDPEVRIALRLGIFQLRYLDRIPAPRLAPRRLDRPPRRSRRNRDRQNIPAPARSPLFE